MVAKLIAVVLPLGLDTFAVAAALGLAGMPAARRRRVSLVMAGFEMAMPLLGLAAGAPLGHALGSAADYLAVAILLGFGLYTLVGRGGEEGEVVGLAEASGWRFALLGMSVSLDELAIGFTLGLLRLPALLVIGAIGAQALLVSQLGLRLGGRLGERGRAGAERLAGVCLAALGLVLLAVRVG